MYIKCLPKIDQCKKLSKFSIQKYEIGDSMKRKVETELKYAVYNMLKIQDKGTEPCVLVLF